MADGVGVLVSSLARLTHRVKLLTTFREHSLARSTLGAAPHVVQVELVRRTVERRNLKQTKTHKYAVKPESQEREKP